MDSKWTVRLEIFFKQINKIFLGKYYNFLGCSNSQMRDGGCYFLNATLPEILQFRKSLGDFPHTNIAKYLSRFGQCFTQSRVKNFCLIKVNIIFFR